LEISATLRATVARASATCLLLLCHTTLCHAQSTYSQATYINTSQFFAGLKQVSLDLRSDPSLAKFVSLSDQRADIVIALAAYGIAIRPGSQVTLVVTVTHHDGAIESKDVQTGAVDSTDVVHGIYFNVEFLLKAAALRNGKLHLVMAAPATSWSGSTLAEDSALRKALLGDQTTKDTKNRFTSLFGEVLKDIATNERPEEVPWAVNSLTPAAKASLDADYAKLARPGLPVAENALEGITAAPQILLDPQFNSDSCKADSDWNAEWTRVFQRLRWTGASSPDLSLSHMFSCVYAYGLAAPRYFALSDRIYMLESNLVFEFNGRLVRKRGEIIFAHHEKLALENTIDESLRDFTSRNIQDFLTDLVLGNTAAPPPAAPPTAVPAATPTRPAAPDPVTTILLRLFGKDLGQSLADTATKSGIRTAIATEAQARAAMFKWVHDDVNVYITASGTRFDTLKAGNVVMSGGNRNWVCKDAPTLSKTCWVVEADTVSTLTALLAESADLNALRAYYTVLADDIGASLPRGWTPGSSQPFGGDLPGKSYTSPGGAHGEFWIARAASGSSYELHFQVVSAPVDDPIGVGGFITPPTRK
jgi:hypothetical protein